MPTILTHAAVAAVGASFFRPLTDRPLHLMVLSAVCAVLPDVDVAGYLWLYIPSGHFFGHRGFFHSPFFAAMMSLLVVSVFFRGWRPLTAAWWRGVVFFFLVGASHGLLDAMTDGGRGIALLSPLSNERYFLPWRPIEVSPLGISRFFGARGFTVLISEAVWIWAPLAAVMLGTAAFRSAGKKAALSRKEKERNDHQKRS